MEKGSKTKISVRLGRDVLDYVDSMASQRGRTRSEVINSALTEYAEYEKSGSFAGKVAEEVEKVLGERMEKTKLSAQFADKNVQIILEILNNLLFLENVKYKEFISTDDLPNRLLKDSKDAVTERIARNKQIKDDRTY